MAKKGWGSVPKTPTGAVPTAKYSAPTEFKELNNAHLRDLVMAYKNKFSISQGSNNDNLYYIRNSVDVILVTVSLWNSKQGKSLVYVNIPHGSDKKDKDNYAVVSLNQGTYPLQDFLDLISSVLNSILFS